MKIITKPKLTPGQAEELRALWNSVYPEKLAHHSLQDFEDYLEGLKKPKHLLLTGPNRKIYGWAVVFTRDTEKWFAVLLNQEVQNKGYGTLFLNALKNMSSELNGWVIDHNRDKLADGRNYSSPLPFYLKNNFMVVRDKFLKNDKISAIKITWRR